MGLFCGTGHYAQEGKKMEIVFVVVAILVAILAGAYPGAYKDFFLGIFSRIWSRNRFSNECVQEIKCLLNRSYKTIALSLLFCVIYVISRQYLTLNDLTLTEIFGLILGVRIIVMSIVVLINTKTQKMYFTSANYPNSVIVCLILSLLAAYCQIAILPRFVDVVIFGLLDIPASMITAFCWSLINSWNFAVPVIGSWFFYDLRFSVAAICIGIIFAVYVILKVLKLREKVL